MVTGLTIDVLSACGAGWEQHGESGGVGPGLLEGHCVVLVVVVLILEVDVGEQEGDSSLQRPGRQLRWS